MQEAMDIGIQFFRLAGSLALVLLVLFLGFYVLKRWGHWMKGASPNPWIQVLAQHSFGPKHYLLVVKVQQQSFLVGVSPQGMQMLSPLESVNTPPDTRAVSHDDARNAQSN